MNRRTTWILVGVAVVLGLYVWYSGRSNGATEAEATTPAPTRVPGSGPLFDATSDQIVSLWIVDMVSNREVALAKDAQGQWAVTAPEARPADPAQAPGWASQFVNVFVSTVITETTDLTPFGVLSSTYTLGIKLADGTNLKVSVGDKTPTGSGYYALRDGEEHVIVVNTGSVDGLTALLTTPPYLLPTATPVPTVDFASTLLAPTATATP